jgi:transcriptional regulator with PAS, ATPase and Fis domain
MRQIVEMTEKLANFDSSVILLGESGVGKGVLAKFTHDNSPRKNKNFVHINCGAIPESLIESELFGYEKGAFTGANKEGKIGLIEKANEGDIVFR